MANIGYARVSTRDQDPQLQLDALEAAGVEHAHVYVEKASGKNTQRPVLTNCLAHLRKGDVLIVWKLDRLGRSVKDLVSIVSDLGERGVEFRSLTEGLDTTTPGGRLIFHVMAGIAQFERDLIRERTQAGLDAAAKAGRRGGRPFEIKGTKLDMLLDRWEKETPDDIAEALGVSRATVYRAYKRAQEDAATASRA